MRRIAVIGTSGSGKTTLARQISEILEIRHIELDQYFWLSDWESREIDEFRGMVEKLTAEEKWVVDGNYGTIRDLIWSRATDIIWLDLSFWITFGRTALRTIKRLYNREILFGGCRESLLRTLFSSDSILWWVIKTHSLWRREYPKLFAQKQYQGIQVTKICNKHELNKLTESLKKL
ncbi:MAG: adenylate kinase [Candidatus Zixiibacteriota bacterium]